MDRAILLATGDSLVGKGVRAFSGVLEEVLRSAREEIQIAVYRIDASATPLLEILEEAAIRGVRVRIILNAMEEQPEIIQNKLSSLAGSAGIQLVDFSRKSGQFLHAKTVVADRQRAIIGSANLTWGGLVQNSEIGVLLEGPRAWELAALLDILAELKHPRIPPGNDSKMP